MRKQTKLWTTKSGEKIRLCDMTDTHLVNAFNMMTRKYYQHRVQGAFVMADFMSGEIASDSIEQECDYVSGPEFDLVEELCYDSPLAQSIYLEIQRRELLDNLD